MFVTTEKTVKKIALAELQGSKNRSEAKFFGTPYDGRNIVIIGAPGSAKFSTMNALLHVSSSMELYEKARSFTDRSPRPGDSESNEFIFPDDSSRKNGLIDFFVTLYRKIIFHLNLLMGRPVIFNSGTLEVIRETVYSVGGHSYGVELNELAGVLSRGKRFMLVTSVNGAVMLKKLFGNKLLVVHLNVPREQRAVHLNHKYEGVAQCKKCVQESLLFGDREVTRLKNQIAFSFLSIKPNSNPISTAEEILLAAEYKVLSAQRKESLLAHK